VEDQTWRCRIRLLGGLRVEHPDRRVVTRFQTQKTGALLAYLAFYLRRSHAREQLAELLWPEVEPRAGRNRLKQALASLRRQIEPSGAADASAAGTATAGRLLVADGHLSVHLDPDVVTTDVADFEAALAAAARAPDAAARRALLERAAQVYGGDLLPGYYEDWVATERERLAEAHRIALRDLADLQEREGQLVPAIDTAYRVLAADPSRPESCERLMRLLDRIGDPEAALRQYRELERRLREEVDDAPTPALRAFAARLAAGPSRGPETPPAAAPETG
jgi:DNA-binding SARP family transcriptional activator